MDPATAMMLAGLVSKIGGGVAGHFLGAKDRKAQEEYLKKALGEYENLDIQDVDSNASVDPQLREAQMGALAKLLQISNDGGHTLEDKAVLNENLNEVARREKGNRDAILQQRAMKGQSGAGDELAALLQNEQSSANRGNQTGLDVAAMAQKRAFDAIMGRADLAGKVQGQDDNRAQSRDIMARYNQDNKFKLANAKYGAYGDAANAAGKRAGETASTWSGVGSGVGDGLMDVGNYQMQRPKVAPVPAPPAQNATRPQLSLPRPPAQAFGDYYPKEDDENGYA